MPVIADHCPVQLAAAGVDMAAVELEVVAELLVAADTGWVVVQQVLEPEVRRMVVPEQAPAWADSRE